MSYKLTFHTDKSLFNFKKIKYSASTTTFEGVSIVTYIPVKAVFYQDTQVVREADEILYSDFPIDYIYMKNGVLHIIPEESPVNVIYTYKI